MGNDKLNAWSSANLRECCSDVEQEDEERKSIVQLILQKSADFLRRIIVPVEGQGGVILSHVCPHCHRCPLGDYLWWVSSGHGDVHRKKKKQRNWWRAACGGQYEWENPNGILIIQDSTDRHEANVFRAHAPPHGVCDKLINALKLLANQQTGGDSPVERSRSTMIATRRWKLATWRRP